MITTWMLFAIVTGALFGVSALAAAHGATAARRPTQSIWLAAFLASAFWPVVVALALAHQSDAESGVGALFLSLEPQLLGMVLRHEEEHRRGQDPRILFATTLIGEGTPGGRRAGAVRSEVATDRRQAAGSAHNTPSSPRKRG